MAVIYGLKNCDTCRKARKWADAEGIEHSFHDVRADGLSDALLGSWLGSVDWEVLLNRRGTTWRGLSDAEKTNVTAESARALMLQHPALIKRPVIQGGNGVTVGFSDDAKANLKA